MILQKIQSFFSFVLILATKGDSMRKVIEHIDERKWRTIEYFRLLDKGNQFELNKTKVTADIVVNC